jgi:hypothetical protein
VELNPGRASRASRHVSLSRLAASACNRRRARSRGELHLRLGMARGRSSSCRARHGAGEIRPGAVRCDRVGLRQCPYAGTLSGCRGELRPGTSSGSGAWVPAVGERRTTCELREGSGRAMSSKRAAHPPVAVVLPQRRDPELQWPPWEGPTMEEWAPLSGAHVEKANHRVGAPFPTRGEGARGGNWGCEQC